MVRKYNVKGTNDYLIFAIALLAFGAWCVKDGWFPSPVVLKKHPMEVPAPARIDGMISTIRVALGQEVGSNTVVGTMNRAEVDTVRQQRVFAERDAAERLQNLKRDKPGDTEAVRAAEALWNEAKARLDEATQRAERTDIVSMDAGTIIRIPAKAGDLVKEGDAVAVVYPTTHSHFYSFNRICSVVCALGALVCFFVHTRVR